MTPEMRLEILKLALGRVGEYAKSAEIIHWIEFFEKYVEQAELPGA